MANSNTTFAVASYGKIQEYISQGILKYPSYVFCKDINTMVFIDKNLQIQKIKGFNQASIVNVDVLPTENIESNTFYLCNGIGYLSINDVLVPVFNYNGETVASYDQLENAPIINKYGDMSSPIILADLPNGAYAVSGQYKVGGNLETIFITSTKALFTIDSDNEYKYITKLDAKNIRVYKVALDSMEVVEDKYATESWVLAQGYTTKEYVTQAISDLYNKLVSEVLITKVSQLENDMGYLTADDLNEVSDIEIANLF